MSSLPERIYKNALKIHEKSSERRRMEVRTCLVEGRLRRQIHGGSICNVSPRGIQQWASTHQLIILLISTTRFVYPCAFTKVWDAWNNITLNSQSALESVILIQAETAVDDTHAAAVDGMRTECFTSANAVVDILYLHQFSITPKSDLRLHSGGRLGERVSSDSHCTIILKCPSAF
jgi:hypothetical protein